MAGADLLATQPGPDRGRRSARRSPATSAAAPATTTSSRRSWPPPRRRRGCRHERHRAAGRQREVGRPGAAAQGGPAADHRPRPLRRRHRRSRACSTWRVVRSPEAHAKIVSIDTSRRQGAARRPRRLHRRGPRPRGAAADGLGAAGRRGQDARALAARQGRGQVRRPGRRRRHRRRQVRASSTPPSRCSSSTTRCRSSSTPRRRSRTARRSSTRSSAPTRRTSGRSAAATSTPRWAEADVVVERRIVNHRTAGAPIEPRGVLADYRAGTLTLHLDQPDPAPDPRCSWPASSGSPRSSVRVIAPDVGGGFGVEAHALRRGDPRCAWASRKLGPPGQVDRDALGAHELDASTAATRSTT